MDMDFPVRGLQSGKVVFRIYYSDLNAAWCVEDLSKYFFSCERTYLVTSAGNIFFVHHWESRQQSPERRQIFRPQFLPKGFRQNVRQPRLCLWISTNIFHQRPTEP